MAKSGLGRGLGALIPESAYNDEEKREREPGSEGIRSIPLGRVKPSPDQPRKRFDDASLGELAESIKRHGVIQPLIVEPDLEDGFRIVAGERRWRAAAMAGLREIPVIIREFGLEKRLEVALVENVQREDLNPVDEAEAYRQLMEITALTQDQVAERVGKSRSAVANSLRLLNLPQDAMEALRSGLASAGHARAILAVLNPAHRAALLKRIVDDGISVREAEAAAQALNSGVKRNGESAKAPKTAPKPLDADLAVLEQNLIGHLGTKVSIKGDARKGSIAFEYFSMDDLERVYALITGERA
ncbi:MAG TPA: chromosome partitioning protein ParB [Spirochaetaceae bacterium]|nr:chromosome partitioning protein ParB [Spirochaetaceae bacterium]